MGIQDGCEMEVLSRSSGVASSPTPDWLSRKLAAEENEEAWLADVFEKLQPRPGRLVVTKPEVSASHEQRQLSSGLFMPDRWSVTQREWGLTAKVLKMNVRDIHAREEGIAVGCEVVIGEHSGIPVYLDRETPWWIIGIDEVIAVVEGRIRARTP